MPISNGRRGGTGPRAIPGDRFLGGHPFRAPQLSRKQEAIAGITKDATGAALGGCTVKLYRSLDDVMIATMVSDASTGAYSFDNPASGPFYVVAYKTGATPVAGTTLNTLVSL